MGKAKAVPRHVLCCISLLRASELPPGGHDLPFSSPYLLKKCFGVLSLRYNNKLIIVFGPCQVLAPQSIMFPGLHPMAMMSTGRGFCNAPPPYPPQIYAPAALAGRGGAQQGAGDSQVINPMLLIKHAPKLNRNKHIAFNVFVVRLASFERYSSVFLIPFEAINTCLLALMMPNASPLGIIVPSHVRRHLMEFLHLNGKRLYHLKSGQNC